MKKQLAGTLAATAALFAIAGMAQAAPAELNIYGASAQYLFWNAQAQNFAQTQLGCTATAPVNNGDKHGFVHATGCTSTLVPQNAANGNSRDLDIRYSGIASAEGPLAVKKAEPLDATLKTSSAGACNVANGERAMYASATTTVCKQVHIGTSDVAGESLTQSSTGCKAGPVGTCVPFSVTNLGNGIKTDTLTPHPTVVVPFGFFVNKNVKAKKCESGNLTGNLCVVDKDCTDAANVTGTCGTAKTIDNITRTQVAQIFSGQAADWSDFGAAYTPQTISACMRHAGSGTHAAFELTVMNAGNTGWGSSLAIAEQAGAAGKLIDGGAADIYFNQSSGNMMDCINAKSGGIGYSDADQTNKTNTVSIKYNGVYPTRSAVRNGLYEFYSAAQLYTPKNVTNALADSLIAFAQDPANIPSVIQYKADGTILAGDKTNYWASATEMNYMRAEDKAYPAFVGATTPQE